MSNSNSVSVVSNAAYSFGEAVFVLVENEEALPSVMEAMITGETASHLFVMVKGDVSPLRVENKMHVARTREALASALAFESDNCIHEHADRFLELSYGYLQTLQKTLRLKSAKALSDLTPSQLDVIASIKGKAHSLVQPLFSSLNQAYLHNVHVTDQKCAPETLKTCLGMLAKPTQHVAPLATAIVQPTKAETTKPVTVSTKPKIEEKPATLAVPSKRVELAKKADEILKEAPPKKALKKTKPATL